MLDAVALMVGIPTKIVNKATVAGTAQSNIFSILKSMAIDGSVVFQAVGTFTVLNGQIESSLDGGTTWNIFDSFDFIESPMKVLSALAGAIYRINFLNVTITSGTLDILASLS